MSTTTVQAAEEFLANLRSMATGDYLAESDREFWEPPYPEEAVTEAQVLLTELLNAAAATANLGDEEITVLAGDADPALFSDTDSDSGSEDHSESILPVVSPRTRAIAASLTPVLDRFAELSDKHFGALLDVEEVDDLVGVVTHLAIDVAAEPQQLSTYVRHYLQSRFDGTL